MEVTRDQLAKALRGVEFTADVIKPDIPGMWVPATPRYPAALADAIFDAIDPPLTADDSAKCTEVVSDSEEGDHECSEPSRFVVERSDGDKSYGSGGGTEEACEAHLADVVSGMVDGDTHIQAVVSIRWDAL